MLATGFMEPCEKVLGRSPVDSSDAGSVAGRGGGTAGGAAAAAADVRADVARAAADRFAQGAAQGRTPRIQQKTVYGTPYNPDTGSARAGALPGGAQPGARTPQTSNSNPERRPAERVRGFALYVGLAEDQIPAGAPKLAEIVAELRNRLAELAPTAQSHAALARAHLDVKATDLQVVRLTLGRQNPQAKSRPQTPAGYPVEPLGSNARAGARLPVRALANPAGARNIGNGRNTANPVSSGVAIDFSRAQVLINGQSAELTYREFGLLRFLVLREGRTVTREEIIDALWKEDTPTGQTGQVENPGATTQTSSIPLASRQHERDSSTSARDALPGFRAIDVHVRRLRAKLGDYGAIVKTVRGRGYRFDRHADVQIIFHAGPSPFVF